MASALWPASGTTTCRSISTDTATRAVSSALEGESMDVFLESFEVHTAFLENPFDECTRAAQQLGERFRCGGCWRGRWARRRRVYNSVCLPNLCTLFVKLAQGQFSEFSSSVCHQRELDAEREMGERLELVVAGWYDRLALFPAVAKKHRVVAYQDNHRDVLS